MIYKTFKSPNISPSSSLYPSQRAIQHSIVIRLAHQLVSKIIIFLFLSRFKTINSIKMQFTNILAIIALLAGSTFAAPAADANPSKHAKVRKPAPTTVSQVNSCGNGATPYCCYAEDERTTVCSILGKTSYGSYLSFYFKTLYIFTFRFSP